MVFKNKFKYILNIDLFGKVPKLYYEGEEKRKSYIGSFSTILYVIIYIGFFIYKINGMLKKIDLSLYETYIFTDGVPSIELTNEIYYGGFALGNPLTLKTFIDETIYYPKGYFISSKKIDDEWIRTIKELEFEICRLEKFGSKYKEFFKNVPLDNLYCLKEINETLEGYMTSDIYSYYKIEFRPCFNSSKNNYSCKPKEIIDQYITSTFIEFKLQDIELTPHNYKTPVEFQRRDVQGVAFKYLLQNIYTHLQIVNIETDEDILGFSYFSNIRKEKYLKYDESFVHVAPSEKDIYANGVLCTVTIQLAGKVLTQKRSYTKLIDVLGEVGGFMGVIYSVFEIVLIFLTNNLYDISLIKNLFSFDLDKNKILIKNIQNSKIEKVTFLDEISNKRENISKDISSNVSSQRILNNNKIRDININQNKANNDNVLISRNLKISKIKKNKSKNQKSSTIHNLETFDNDNIKNSNLNIKNNNQINNNNNINKYNFNNKNYIDGKKDKIEEKDKKNEKENKPNLNEIKLNIFYTYFCVDCIRKRNNIKNNLIDQSLRLIAQKLDILNLFNKLYIYEEFLEKKHLT